MSYKIKDFIEELKQLPDLSSEIVYHHKIVEKKPKFEDPLRSLPLLLKRALNDMGINALYLHQAQAIDLIREGKNVVIVTPTASGKTLTYNLPVFESLLKGEPFHSLYIFPLKALAQDQLKNILEFSRFLRGAEISVAIYDGDTPAEQRKKIKKKLPSIIITNPDMLHLGILAYHYQWESFFRNLKYIVIDELHTYRGIFGTHMVQLIRRLRRICQYYGSYPQFITCSATIANPKEFAESLTGLPFHVISDNGAPKPGGHFIFFNPDLSTYTTAYKLFIHAIKKGFKTIAFTRARKITELIHMWILQRAPEIAGKISSYRSGFLPEERREIEKKLFSGDLHGVVSTSALEMGIDIGGMDVCILVGYPGTITNTWQRSGRVGRGEEEFLIVLVAQNDALDQYFIRYPEDFFSRNYEHAVVDPHNSQILKEHLVCAAAEIPLSIKETPFPMNRYASELKELEKEGRLLQEASGKHWFSREKNPHLKINLRGTGESYTIFEQDGHRVIGQIDGWRAYTECHPGAIYLHRARQFLIKELNLEKRSIYARSVDENYFTKPLVEKHTSILSTDRSNLHSNFHLGQGRLKVTEIFKGYEKRAILGQELLATYPLELTPQTFETVGIWLEIEGKLKDMSLRAGNHFMGSLHAMEHALISIFPLFTLCDSNDLGGISTPFHPQLEQGAIFIYDGYPGGVGLSARAFDIIENLLKTVLKLLRTCPCSEGCPSCIQSPKCGSSNRPLDKEGAILLLSFLSGETNMTKRDTKNNGNFPLPLPSHKGRFFTSQCPQPILSPLAGKGKGGCEPSPTGGEEVSSPQQGGKVQVPEKKPTPTNSKEEGRGGGDRWKGKRILFFDLETQKGAEEVGGWENRHLMKLAVGVIYDSLKEEYLTFTEKDVDKLIETLESADLVVGFNLIRFDYEVLKGYVGDKFQTPKTIDILKEIQKTLGHRLSLNHLAKNTLHVEKIADGLQCLKWFKEGKINQVTEYCIRDVEITKDLFWFGVKNGYLIGEKDWKTVKIPVDW